MYAIIPIEKIRQVTPEICTKLPSEITACLRELIPLAQLSMYRIVRLSPEGNVEHVCRADRWAEPKLGAKKF